MVVALAVLGGCDAGPVPATPPITPGTGAVPRQVNVILTEFSFEPAVVDLVPGETIRLNVVNEGLEVHELVLGPRAVQDAWAAAEAAAANPPPGATPTVVVPASLQGVRLVVGSGQTVSITYTVPTSGPPLLLGCHIADHYQRGMSGVVRLVGPGGVPLSSQPPGG